jgi:hypothetical protein
MGATTKGSILVRLAWLVQFLQLPYYPILLLLSAMVSVPSSPQEYIERSRDYDSPVGHMVLPESKSYYPYVKECHG